MTLTRKFWPLDFDLEEEIFDSPSWGLPGLKRLAKHRGKPSTSRPVRKPASKPAEA